MMKEIKTYKDLCKEIERIKKSIEEVKKGLGYEQGDEFDLELYLIQLKKAKVKADKEWKLMERIGATECKRCGKDNLIIEQQYNIPSLSYDFAVECNDCGHIEFTSIPKIEFIELLIVGEYDWLFVGD